MKHLEMRFAPHQLSGQGYLCVFDFRHPNADIQTPSFWGELPIEMFYNPKRKHATNGLLSPVNFERQQQMKPQGV